MAAKGIHSAAGLARKMKLPRQTIHRWLNGETEHIHPELVYRLSDVLECSARWLVMRDVAPSRAQRLNLDEQRVLALFKALPEAVRDSWVNTGDTLLVATTQPSRIHPHKR